MSIETALPIGFAVAIFGLVAMAAITGVRRGWDPDVAGTRARALYLYGVTFVSLVVAAFSIEALASAITRIILPSEVIPVTVVPGIGFDPDKQFTNEAVLAGLLAIAALLVFLFAYRRGNQAMREAGWLEGPAGRIRRGYLYLGSFVWIVIVLFAGVFAAFGLYQVLVPGTAGLGAPHNVVRDRGIVSLVSLGLLALFALAAFRGHWGRVSPGGRSTADAGGGPAASPPMAPHAGPTSNHPAPPHVPPPHHTLPPPPPPPHYPPSGG